MASANAPNRAPAFSRVLYVTHQNPEQWFIPTTGRGDNPNSGTTAQRLDACEELLGRDTDNANQDVGKAVQANTLADW